MKTEVLAYKLFALKDGKLHSLFIGKDKPYEIGVTYEAEDLPTKGYAHRPGFHCVDAPEAPHMSCKGRVWAEVRLCQAEPHFRPASQGGLWWTGKYMTVLRVAHGYRHSNRFDDRG